MGCGGSKVDDLPLVTLCKKRKEYIKATANHRYALASSHVSYFRSLKDVGEALCRFVEEELVIGVGSSPPSSPVLTLPSDEGKKKKDNKDSSSSTSLSHSLSFSHHHSPEEDSHIHIDSGSDTEAESESSKLHSHGSPEGPEPEASSSWPPIDSRGNPYPYSYSTYYMKRSSTAVPSVVYEGPRMSTAAAQWPEYSYSGNPQYGMGGYFGIPMHSPPRDPYNNRPPSPPAATPSPPPPPQVSAWDFLDPFNSVDGGYPGYYSRGSYRIGSTTSSPDSKEVREREGIPDLEDENEPKPLKEAEQRKGKKVEEDVKGDSGEGTSRAAAPLQSEDSLPSVQEKEIKSSPETIAPKSIEEEENPRRKGVSFEINEASTKVGELGGHVESSKASSLTTLAAHGTRDLREVVKEIRDEFVNASEYGKEVAVLLEVGKLPYQSRRTILKVISSRILDFITTPTVTFSHPPSRRSERAADSTTKMAKGLIGGSEMDIRMKLSSTLEQLYVWEKKLYKEVKDEERLRVIYEKKCKRLKVLDDSGAETYKIDATQASIRKLLTKIDVAIRAIDAISNRIHKLRDEELQPQLTELIHGLTRMWRSMLKCHQKQFQAIIESKSRNLIANTSVRRDSSLRATVELEVQLLNWCTRFNTWVNTQKAYVESLNGWLLNSLHQEREETLDGVIPFSPSRVGAPPAFITGNDWFHAMERLSETGVADAIHAFALSLHGLWERQDEEQRQRLKAEYLTKDFEKRLRSLRKEEIRLHRDQDALSEKTTVSVIPTESGVSPLDDLKVDLDSMRKRLEEERARHKETIKEVHNAASSSLQAGLIPIFEALGNFVAETLKVYEQVRTEDAGDGT
ncbi:protein ALTERED PHOSPHATE STARVATION RESPONSE 1-like [Telopea speciosissima]|uniref:protein ALTERED PHOSPHATE STARVATION RESPONSE 1-like n=1 Tax=Telopea speciosissima TaxID=54955 RepID=UPI001CC394BE|nr:protein ALTERED PHOSPHATE STARVATION RESPONSE 1-like [Telopea speciosissima]XP_043720496.1 protein ALTERED PHOSPHATE STARVATION RESPONSE 1-like [Telopea speciosissima]XP_043720497.1 protein ALTERED PHOSPHATE STARVATION RESPONSE 1-like [Telopea speciosissima]